MQSRRAWGSEFQSVGAVMTKALSPQCCRLVLCEMERRFAWGVGEEQIGEVGGGEIVDGLEGEEKQFVLDAV